MSQNQSEKKKLYKVTSAGPINIGGVLKRKDDTVLLTSAEAKSYAAHIGKRPLPSEADAKPDTKTKPETKTGKAKK